LIGKCLRLFEFWGARVSPYLRWTG
jgi:hypothetical protein